MEFPPVELFAVKLEDIQPSQFYVDQEKLAAVRDFVKGGGNCKAVLFRNLNGGGNRMHFGARYMVLQ